MARPRPAKSFPALRSDENRARAPQTGKKRYDMDVNDPHFNGVERIDSFALVTYIPDPLARFLDELRSEIEPAHPAPRAHVTVLPPRPLPASEEAARSQLRTQLGECASFEIAAGDVEVFPGTNVVYLAVARGFSALQRMYSALNNGAVLFREPFPFHPHITLAQNLDEATAQAVAERVRDRWAKYRGGRSFTAGSFVFVQATQGGRWVDLERYELQPAHVGR
jgi:2'-5' RNA ligase